MNNNSYLLKGLLYGLLFIVSFGSLIKSAFSLDFSNYEDCFTSMLFPLILLTIQSLISIVTYKLEQEIKLFTPFMAVSIVIFIFCLILGTIRFFIIDIPIMEVIECNEIYVIKLIDNEFINNQKYILSLKFYFSIQLLTNFSYSVMSFITSIIDLIKSSNENN